MSRILVKLGLATIFCLMMFGVANAQTANLSGTVVDGNGAVIPGVKITILNTENSARRDIETNDDGKFTVPSLPPGKYSLSAQREGFASFELQSIVLNVNDERSLRISLNTGSIKVAVQVTTDSSLINESPAVATTVDRKFVENIPLNGRSFQSLIALAPGTVVGNFASTGGDNTVTGFSVNGQRALANYFTVDGVSANVGTTANADIGVQAGGAAPATTIGGGTQSLLSLDAMQEFTMQTSTTSAKFGK
ncbi:MAG TPA: carboxypeptidase-like regulatory domain-containing protein, partial [Pyrinomonadaceae bacterium]|nr:carboxypeptidase-like regulatory domain-containing protein [Pyrinomonadaceae bacterium]